MDPGNTLLSALIKEVVSGIRQYIGQAENVAPDLASRLLTHLRTVDAWSGEIQFLGMTRPLETDAASVALEIMAEPRRFRSKQTKSPALSEFDLLKDSHDYVILGDPRVRKNYNRETYRPQDSLHST